MYKYIQVYTGIYRYIQVFPPTWDHETNLVIIPTGDIQ